MDPAWSGLSVGLSRFRFVVGNDRALANVIRDFHAAHAVVFRMLSARKEWTDLGVCRQVCLIQNNMKHKLLFAAAISIFSASIWAQSPGKAENNGVTPTSPTFYVNTPNTILNLSASTENNGISIARNGNVIIGFENDGDGVLDLEAVWSLFDREGKLLTLDVEQKSKSPDAGGKSVTSHFLSFFNGTNALPGRAAWGTKIKANLFGDGVGMAATAYDLGVDIPELTAIQNTIAGENAGDFPAVQLLSNNGEPLGVLSGVSDAYAEREGDIRIADWDYLSTGNVVIVGESRQQQDLVDIYQGPDAKIHAIVRIVDRTGKEINAVQLASATPDLAEMFHGAGVTKDGFAVRFKGADGRAAIRLFNNLGTPLSANLDLGVVAGNEIMAGGSRGDDVGFHGNGNDSYAATATGTDSEGNKRVWVTVLDTKGAVRWSKAASDDVTLTGLGECDVAIDSIGRVVVVYSAYGESHDGKPLIMARLFDNKGEPAGNTFLVSESELPSNAVSSSNLPRIAFRDDNIAITWVSRNGGHFDVENAENKDAGVVAARFFAVPTLKISSIKAAGSKFTLDWVGGIPPFKVQRRTSLGSGTWSTVTTTSERSASVDSDGNAGFFQISQ